jgi:hypothetical protein
MATRVSHEALILAKVRDALTDLPGVTYASGMGAANRFPLDGWHLVGSQQFQFGDLRIETPSTTIVVEAESGGGVTNLAKYWPYLAARPAKRFVLAHLFQVLSANDYVSHIRLWEFLVERMRDDLDARSGLRWPEHWEARAFRYGPQLDATLDVAAYLRAAAN